MFGVHVRASHPKDNIPSLHGPGWGFLWLDPGALVILVALGIAVALAANSLLSTWGGADEEGNVLACSPSGSASSAFPAAFSVILLGAGAGLGHEILRSGGVVTLPRRVNGGRFHLGGLVGVREASSDDGSVGL